MYKFKSKFRTNSSGFTIKETPTNRSKSWLTYKLNGQNFAQISSKIFIFLLLFLFFEGWNNFYFALNVDFTINVVILTYR